MMSAKEPHTLKNSEVIQRGRFQHTRKCKHLHEAVSLTYANSPLAFVIVSKSLVYYTALPWQGFKEECYFQNNISGFANFGRNSSKSVCQWGLALEQFLSIQTYVCKQSISLPKSSCSTAGHIGAFLLLLPASFSSKVPAMRRVESCWPLTARFLVFSPVVIREMNLLHVQVYFENLVENGNLENARVVWRKEMRKSGRPQVITRNAILVTQWHKTASVLFTRMISLLFSIKEKRH